MFAVPGWSLSSKKIVQEQPKSSKDRNKQSPGVKEVEQSEKKRKRGGRDEGKDSKRAKQDPKPRRELPKTARRENKEEGSDRVKQHKSDHKSSHTRTDSTGHGHKDRRQDRRKGEGEENGSLMAAAGPIKLVPLSPPSQAVKLTPLQAKMRAKLTSARFRHLNETLYTTDSNSAMNLFTSSPELFAEYHAGFSQQVKDSWPQNPVDNYVKTIKMRSPLAHPKGALQPLPRRKTGSCTIADLGCGDAPLARNLKSACKKFGLRIHSYDLHAPNEFVTKADMTSLPLRDGEADLAIFCLSLMGTNWLSFVEEAWRILRGDGKGEVWVAEVKSRFGRVGKRAPGTVVENSVGKRRKQQKTAKDDEGDVNADDRFAEDVRDENKADETDVSAFVNVFQRRGFVLREETVDKSNKMFVSMVFVKSGVPTAGKHKGMKWNGNEYQKMEDRGGNKRFANGQGRGEREEVDEKEEAKVLKPCVYKTR